MRISFSRTLRRLASEKRGNILLLAAAGIPLLLFAIGFCIDYSNAERLQSKLNAVADAAALAAVDPTMLGQSSAVAKEAAEKMFDQQVSGLTGVKVSSRVVIIDDASSGSLGTLRTARVSYNGTSSNYFASILGMPTLSIHGTASANSSQPPSMNFYIALDTSPSMLLPTTSAGIDNLIAGARWNGELVRFGRADGCAFACHSGNMQQWNNGTYVVDSHKNAIYLNNGANAGSMPFFRVSCDGTVFDNNGTIIGGYAQIRVSENGGTSDNYCSGYSPASNPVILRYRPGGTGSYTSVSVNFPDTWWLARNYGLVNPGSSQITLRTDAESSAAAGVIQYAYTLQRQYAGATVPPVYKMQFFTFNIGSPAALDVSPFGAMCQRRSKSRPFGGVKPGHRVTCRGEWREGVARGPLPPALV
ncbi:hypothetical protein KNJ79_18335 [Sphingopyxis indica]|uniref:TadE/TadG family type IV pilus assembly protein n=1 Tax=Sphingopyxis indica TaxID=436663 RepID=UPI002938D28F|nr:pilus assembly protein TadG-related protein [Sphingopyxis indica]WOF43065.1 hypothetical protein KNJ79_18335 [Sphingopyxis indica]